MRPAFIWNHCSSGGSISPAAVDPVPELVFDQFCAEYDRIERMVTRHDPHRAAAAFASRDFRHYQMARLLVIMGAEAQAVAVAWQIYQITHRAIDLGYTGLFLFLPGILFLLISGHTADRYDRRRVILVCYTLQCLCTGTLFYLSWSGTQHVAALFGVLFL